MQNPNDNRTDRAASDFFHSQTFTLIVIIFSCLFGIPIIFMSCLLWILLLSIIIPGLGVVAVTVGTIVAIIAELLSIPYPPP
jgi:hypothetical protein